MTSDELARVTDLTRLENARMFLRELETVDGDALASHLREPIAELKRGIKVRNERADAGKARGDAKQGSLIDGK